ncbi:MAG TPA: LysR family transcriptional regulator [Solirubrobacteraceae bacterium]|nr:LysR family transcriptional regulator [Solirubrobacteraceae bacterium]
MLDAARLRVFREVVRQGSFSAAAEALSFTQPAVSRQVAALEREAGARLLERTARGIRLTEPGRVLLEHAGPILDRLAAAQSQVASVARLEGGRLRVGAFPTANATIVPRAIAAFAAEHPAVELSLVESVSDDLLGALCAGEIDVAVVTDHVAASADPAAIEAVELAEDELLVALPAGHPLAFAADLGLDDLRDEVWIEGAHASCRRPLVLAAAGCGFEPDIRFGSEQWLGKQGLVAAGVGICLIPGLAIATVRDDVVLRRLARGAPSRRVLALLSRGYRAPAAEPFVELLRREAAEHCVSCLERARLQTQRGASAVAAPA